MYCKTKTIFETSSRTNILSKAVLTGYQIDNVNTAIIMKDTPCIISSIGDAACETIGTY